MDNPAKPPITLYRESSNSRLANLKKGLSIDDQKLVERLEELSDVSRTARRKSDQPDADLAARLAKLKGASFKSTEIKPKLTFSTAKN